MKCEPRLTSPCTNIWLIHTGCAKCLAMLVPTYKQLVPPGYLVMSSSILNIFASFVHLTCSFRFQMFSGYGRVLIGNMT